MYTTGLTSPAADAGVERLVRRAERRLRRVQRSMTTSPLGREQQMSTLPAAGGSSGSGS